MPSEITKLARRKKALKGISELSSNEEHVLIIHYSCEGFYGQHEGKTPRVTSIAVRNYASGQTESFSIHKVAELTGVNFSDIGDKYDTLEADMLKEFYCFMSQNKTHTWVHWNMRDISYGFPALEHRYRVLKGTPEELDESKKFDLSRALVFIYGHGYIGHPRLVEIIKKNNITDRDLLDGPGEVAAFDEKRFVELHQSTLRKVDVLAGIMGRVIDKNLKTNTTWLDMHGVNLKIILEYIVKHWIFTLVTGVIGLSSAISYIYHVF